MNNSDYPIAEALRLLRTQAGLTQTAASKRDGAPDFRTLSHWETRRKNPSLRLLARYLGSLGLDFHDLQDGLDQFAGVGPGSRRFDQLASQIEQLQRRVDRIEVGNTDCQE